jgi:hypothetical protein
VDDATELAPLFGRHPSVLIHMGGAPARRLEDMDVRSAEEGVTTVRMPSRP